ncbi:MAG: multiheme c-type cytochrome [Planctomycetota bacterium]|nr:multiheme c-type cytochrome [Planctomycetota bacterium]
MSLQWRRNSLVFVLAGLMFASSQAAEPALLGNQSCATSTCHGGVTSSGPAWNHSLSTWIAKDPHAGAGLLLRDQRSRQIILRLDPAAADSDDVFDNVLRERCISCHVTVTAEETRAGEQLSNAVLAIGVSCESCHGPAESWLGEHVQADWHGEKRFAKSTGMRDTESVIGRAATCVRCHVGSRTADGMVRDMNHDLIAAGHPALRFDLLLYNENMPRHWDASSEAENAFQQSAIRVRDVGRAMNLAASLELSAQRAVDHLNTREAVSLVSNQVPWPELADYDCFACHQSLDFQRAESTVVSSGVPIWNAWSTVRQLAMTPAAMASLAPIRSDSERIANIAKLLPVKAREWRSNAVALASQEVSSSERLNQIRNELLQVRKFSWYEAAIQYLRLDAVQRDLAKDPDKAVMAEQMAKGLSMVEKSLRFDPDRLKSQRGRYHSPARFEVNKFRDAMNAALQAAMNPVSDANPASDVSSTMSANSANTDRNLPIFLSRSVASQP